MYGYKDHSWEEAAYDILKGLESSIRLVSNDDYDWLFEGDRISTIGAQAFDEWLGATQWQPERDHAVRFLVNVLASKQHDYGHDNITKFGMDGVRVRLWDKIARYNNLKGRGGEAVLEPIEDTLMDMVGYAVIHGMLSVETFTRPLQMDMKPEVFDVDGLLEELKTDVATVNEVGMQTEVTVHDGDWSQGPGGPWWVTDAPLPEWTTEPKATEKSEVRLLAERTWGVDGRRWNEPH